MDTFKQRIRNRYFLMALAGIVYQVLRYFGIALDESLYRTILDVVSYLLMGVGIFTNYDTPQPPPPYPKQEVIYLPPPEEPKDNQPTI
jgi:uncharacterized membrane protein